MFGHLLGESRIVAVKNGPPLYAQRCKIEIRIKGTDSEEVSNELVNVIDDDRVSRWRGRPTGHRENEGRLRAGHRDCKKHAPSCNGVRIANGFKLLECPDAVVEVGKVSGSVFQFVRLPEAIEVMPEYYQLVPRHAARKVAFEVKLHGVVEEVPSDRARDCESRPSRGHIVLSGHTKIVTMDVQRRGWDCEPEALEKRREKSCHWFGNRMLL